MDGVYGDKIVLTDIRFPTIMSTNFTLIDDNTEKALVIAILALVIWSWLFLCTFGCALLDFHQRTQFITKTLVKIKKHVKPTLVSAVSAFPTQVQVQLRRTEPSQTQIV